jgi:hypothetical protein
MVDALPYPGNRTKEGFPFYIRIFALSSRPMNPFFTLPEKKTDSLAHGGVPGARLCGNDSPLL